MERAETLAGVARETAGCTRCGLRESCTRVVFGSGSVDAPLMVVGEAPGFREDRAGTPFQGQAGALLARLLDEIGLGPADVYQTTVVKCRPPGNRDPLEEEIAACEPHLFRELELVRPRVVVSLGNVATRLLTGRPHGVTEVHGRPEQVVVAGGALTVLPLYDPAAALYAPDTVAELEADVALLPGLLGLEAPTPSPLAPAAPEPALVGAGSGPVEQLGLF